MLMMMMMTMNKCDKRHRSTTVCITHTKEIRTNLEFLKSLLVSKSVQNHITTKVYQTSNFFKMHKNLHSIAKQIY